MQLTDLEAYNQFKAYWAAQNYTDAISLLSQYPDLQYKISNASLFNSFFTNLTTLQNNNDPTFKANRIPISNTEPTGQTTGQVWFQLI